MVIAVLLDKFFEAKKRLREEAVESDIDYTEHPLDRLLENIACRFVPS